MEDTNTDSNQTISLNQDFREAAVHDPSIIYADDHYYVIGSHLAFAKSPDLIGTRISRRRVFDKRVVRGRHRFVGGKLQLCQNGYALGKRHNPTEGWEILSLLLFL